MSALVKGGCRGQVNGAAALPAAPEMLLWAQAVTFGATSRHSRGPPATAAVDLSCEQAAAIIAHDRESHGRDLYLAMEGGDFPRWTLFIQMMTDAQAKAFRFNPF